MPVLSADLIRRYPRRPALIVAALLVAAAVWHACLPAFYSGAAVYLRGPLPAIVGVAVALYLYRAAPAWLQAFAACAAGLLASLLTSLLLGVWFLGLLGAIRGTWNQISSCLHWPLAAIPMLWDSPYFLYAFWSGLLPLLLWGSIAFVALLLSRPEARAQLAELLGGLNDRRAFSAAQRSQMRDYRKLYLAALRGGETPPPVPAGMVITGQAVGGLAHSYYVLKIALAIAGAFGLAGGAWSLLGDALRGPATTIFLRGLFGG